MNYTPQGHVGSTGDVPNCFMIPHGLSDFVSDGTRIETDESGRNMYLFFGQLYQPEAETCPDCACRMHVNNTYPTTLRHLPFGSALSFVRFTRRQYLCPKCERTHMESVAFRADHHRITKELENYTETLLSYGYTNKEVSSMTGLAQHTVKAIDKERLRRKYTEGSEGEEGNPLRLKKPEKHARILMIDEFKLHNNYRYATHIIDGETGHILWIGHGKRKQIVYDFIHHVGMEWMEHVEAIACDMNSDFQEAFEEKCEWIQPVFDHFHIVKNFNDKVIGAVRKDEQRRLIEEGNIEAAKSLKKTKHILCANRETLRSWDLEAGQIAIPAGGLFNRPEVVRNGGHLEQYQSLLQQNKLLFTVDLVKEKLSEAFKLTDEFSMSEQIHEIIDLCHATENCHFKWFARLLEKHITGIIAHATFHISSGKIEGINNKIKTLRRQGFGYPDDDYFFLKVMDTSRRSYVRNPVSHKFLQ